MTVAPPGGPGPAPGGPAPGGPAPGGPAPGGSAATVPWDLSHLRAGLITTAALAAVGVPGAWLLRDARAAAWVAIGLAIVAAFFCLGALAVAAAGRIGDELTLPAALGTYLIKVLLLGILLVSVRGQPWLDPAALGWSVIVGTLAWTTVHARRVWTAQTYYVDPGPHR